MSVVHVVDRVKAGHGRGITALAVAQAQYRAGWDVRLLLSGVRSPELLPSGLPHEALLGDRTVEVYRRVGAIDRVSGALERMTALGDTIVNHEGIDLAAACQLGNRRIVAAVHSSPVDCLGYLPADALEVVAERTDRWIAWGSVVAAQLIELLPIDRTRIIVSAQSVEPGCRIVRAMAGSPACLSVARIHPIKNHTLMLETLAVLAECLPGVHWHMVGSCDDQAYLRGLQALADRLGVSDRVTWHGYRHDAAAMMLGCSVTVLASHSEGVPRAIQEAMVQGVPAVMPAAFAQDLSHAGLPMTYRLQQPNALAEAIRAALIVDSSQLAVAAHWVIRRWGWATVLRDWEQIFEAVQA